MGRRGPPPKPTALKRLAGNPGHRPLNKNEPRFPPGVPPCPKSVLADPIAKAEWDRVVPELLKMGVLSEVHMAGLAAYCNSFSEWQHAEEILRRDGRTYTHSNGTVCAHPAVSVSNQAKAELRAWATHFGMTPASSSRLGVTAPADPESEKARRFFGD